MRFGKSKSFITYGGQSTLLQQEVVLMCHIVGDQAVVSRLVLLWKSQFSDCQLKQCLNVQQSGHSKQNSERSYVKGLKNETFLFKREKVKIVMFC